jgi:hypothetical protein
MFFPLIVTYVTHAVAAFHLTAAHGAELMLVATSVVAALLAMKKAPIAAGAG